MIFQIGYYSELKKDISRSDTKIRKIKINFIMNYLKNTRFNIHNLTVCYSLFFSSMSAVDGIGSVRNRYRGEARLYDTGYTVMTLV